MLVEIKGIGLPNRGAELMLLAVIEQFKRRGISAQFAMEPLGDFQLRARYGMYQKTRSYLWNLNFGALLSLLPGRLRARFGLVTLNEVDLVLDASGFAYGDSWAHLQIKKGTVGELSQIVRKNKPLVVLPQAFGPFSKPKQRASTKKLVAVADLIFARDEQSLDYLRGICDRDIPLAPDFTNLIEVETLARWENYSGRPCLIPNEKMFKLGTNSKEDYLHFLERLVTYLLSVGEKPFFLLHEGVGDLRVAEHVKQKLSGNIDIVMPESAFEIKCILSRASLVVSSRFHGLVSALSTSVPVIALGWSHKYSALLSDYGVPELHLDLDWSAVESALQTLLFDRKKRSDYIAVIAKAAAEQKQRSISMWDEVFAFIEARCDSNVDE